MTFEEFVAEATKGSVRPYRYQTALAESGLPEVLRAPTGSGKTLAAVLPWLYRRIAHPDAAVRAEMPHWLVVVLPQRTLVEQTVDAARRWVAALGAPAAVHVLMGGEDRRDSEWKARPDTERIFVGTQDMVLSRLLMRGFAESRAAWPMSFGLLHAGTQFVFDEVQLMGPGLPTSLQLQGLREAFGTALPCRSMWMSATIDVAELSTVDLRRPLSVVDVTDEGGELARRMAATRTIRQLDLGADAKKYPATLAASVVNEHRPGTRTLVVLNTVERAMDVHAEVKRLDPSADTVLLHSRFRPTDRASQTAAALAEPGPEGTIVIATQVLEAGVDVTSETLITEVAPWPSIVQRAGRCNRDGRAADARLLWTVSVGAKAHLPYDSDDLESAAKALAGIEDRAMTGRELAEQKVFVTRPIHPVLRRRDLLDLFDTAPDLAGNDIDVSPFIRDAADRTVSVAWRRDLDAQDMPTADRTELCQAPIADVQDMVTSEPKRARIWDQVDGTWRPVRRDDVRPGAVIVLDASQGGYLPERGFDRRSKQPVEPITVPSRTPDAFDRDPLSVGFPQWVALDKHLHETEAAAHELIPRFGPDVDLTPQQRDAILRAALLHDLGKAHPTFAASLEKANPDTPPPVSSAPWAKSPSNRPLRHDPPHFRHELASALWLLDPSIRLLDDHQERDLVVYLVAAHHGKVRVTIRGKPDERPGVTLGVEDGSSTIGFALNGRQIPAVTLSLRPTTHGADSLTSRALALRDRADLGPFRLAFCEAVVRAADWQASANGGL
ncbi:CRISPR-associated helicase/endonuclease Cas3 [Mycobacterium canetti]|uniref:CRISPR-associated helicase/endonuclease Cas3 n=1 Tax=Mycobacterium canetti TaxID=78331 RepID=UPI0002A55BA3|nr:CRISPR-associated helicase/endonuclease Cas3 [Mycobacterium canetti]CCK60926.1 Putative CRISPR-associated helicase Cas3 [Mycobacterium canettii CIPT 140070010]